MNENLLFVYILILSVIAFFLLRALYLKTGPRMVYLLVYPLCWIAVYFCMVSLPWQEASLWEKYSEYLLAAFFVVGYPLVSSEYAVRIGGKIYYRFSPLEPHQKQTLNQLEIFLWIFIFVLTSLPIFGFFLCLYFYVAFFVFEVEIRENGIFYYYCKTTRFISWREIESCQRNDESLQITYSSETGESRNLLCYWYSKEKEANLTNASLFIQERIKKIAPYSKEGSCSE